MSPAIEVSSLVKRYDGRAVVDELSFTVPRGEVFALLGPNGAGKTTTVEIIEGFRSPDAGTARVLGLDARRDHRRLAPRIGVMPQEGGLYAGIRPPEALRQFASFYDNPMDPAELLGMVALEHAAKTNWRRMSGGEQQRLSLAIAIVGRPEVAFLDEPTSGMDVHARASTWDVIRSLRERGATVLLTTHLLDEAERLADRVAIVHRGRLVAIGAPSQLLARASQDIRFGARTGLDTAAIGAAVGGLASEEGPGSYRISGVEPSPAVVARVTSWLAEHDVAITSLVTGARSLEEVFLELTKDRTA